MMAMLHARGKLKLNQLIQSEGLLGTGTFEGCLVGETTLGNSVAVRPTVKGTANILGTARWTIDAAATAKAREEIRRARGWTEVPKVQWHDPLTPAAGAVRAAE